MNQQPQGYLDFVNSDGSVGPLNIDGRQIISQDRLLGNIMFNLERDVPRFTNTSGRSIRRDGPLAVVSCGHSLNAHLDELREFKNIMACGSVHDHLVRNSIIPTYATVCDGGEADKGNLSLPNKETLYLIASQCDPGLFDALDGYNVEMWHYKGQTAQNPAVETKILNGEPSIGWGSTVTLCSIHIALLLGFQRLDFFGFDNCYPEDASTYHACDVAGGIEYQKTIVKVGERSFVSNLALCVQLEQFFRFIEAWQEWFHVTIHGDGLTSEAIKQGHPGLERYLSLA